MVARHDVSVESARRAEHKDAPGPKAGCPHHFREAVSLSGRPFLASEIREETIVLRDL